MHSCSYSLLGDLLAHVFVTIGRRESSEDLATIVSINGRAK
jgi:hypothetical protein